jgi:hypothetical protein
VSQSRHHDRVEDSEVGPAGIKQGPDAEVLEVGEAEGYPLDPFQQVVDALTRTVGTLAWCQAAMGSNQLDKIRARVRTSASLTQ